MTDRSWKAVTVTPANSLGPFAGWVASDHRFEIGEYRTLDGAAVFILHDWLGCQCGGGDTLERAQANCEEIADERIRDIEGGRKATVGIPYNVTETH